jgi:diguanylate cyclase (GGDEF)-like protein
MHIVERSKIEKRPILIMHPLNKLELGANIVPLDNLKSLICIPIFRNGMPDLASAPNDRNIIAYIYMESEKVLNNFNNNIIEQCMEMNNIISFIIEKYLLNQTAYVDKLTNTLTRKALDDKIIECTDKYKNEGTFSLIMFDLDMFKRINDKFGHQTGDVVLKKICELVLDNLDKKSFCGRFGGEEFIIILPDVSFDNAYVFSEDLRMKIENAHILGDRFPVTVSIGISNFPTHGQWKQELVEKADQALYIAKESGRNRSQCWSSEFTNKFKVTNKLTGIISGNPVEDYRKVSVMIELINLIKSIDSKEEKIYKLLGRIIEATEAQNGILFIITGEEIAKIYGRTKYQEAWLDKPIYNEELLKSVIETTQGKYLIDWEEMLDYDPITQIPDWYSIMIIPIEDTGVLTGVLYLKVPISHKEFSFDDFNFISTLALITACLIK